MRSGSDTIFPDQDRTQTEKFHNALISDGNSLVDPSIISTESD